MTAPRSRAPTTRARGDTEALCSPEDGWVKVHPTPGTMLFREILHGQLGYTEGQGVYNVVRSSEATTRQLQAAIFHALLNATTYRDLEADWLCHVAARGLQPQRLVRRYRNAREADIAGVAERVFDTWRNTLRTTLLDFAHGLVACFAPGGPSGLTSFPKYIDWLTCLGLVPILRKRQEGGVTQGLRAFSRWNSLTQLATVAEAAERAGPGFFELALAFDSTRVADYDRVYIYYNHRRGDWLVRDPISGQRGECLVLWPPLWTGDRLVFDSPVQRLFPEIVACHSLREHAHARWPRQRASVKVLLGRKSDSERGVAGAARVVNKVLGEDDDIARRSAASRLVCVAINMKGMRHVGDINDTVRAYLDEAGGHLIDAPAVDGTLPGFGKGGNSRGSAAQDQVRAPQLRQAFRTAVVNINGVLRLSINELFGTIERLRETNAGLATQLQERDRELRRATAGALERQQRAADLPAESVTGGCGSRPAGADLLRADYDIIDVSKSMDDDTYVANSFQHPYIPSYAQDLERLSRLWEHELVRCFKILCHRNNQGQETSISYSSGAIAAFVAPYFESVLRAPRVGAPITGSDVILGEEELWDAVFKKTRLQTYLTDIAALFVADVQHAALPPPPSPVGADFRPGASPRGRSRSRSPARTARGAPDQGGGIGHRDGRRDGRR
ncbi:capsid portal protein [Human alphaherpesvirus 1]|nr:capsid portal protein [Human alphaherpesvirus 1]